MEHTTADITRHDAEILTQAFGELTKDAIKITLVHTGEEHYHGQTTYHLERVYEYACRAAHWAGLLLAINHE